MVRAWLGRFTAASSSTSCRAMTSASTRRIASIRIGWRAAQSPMLCQMLKVTSFSGRLPEGVIEAQAASGVAARPVRRVRRSSMAIPLILAPL